MVSTPAISLIGQSLFGRQRAIYRAFIMIIIISGLVLFYYCYYNTMSISPILSVATFVLVVQFLLQYLLSELHSHGLYDPRISNFKRKLAIAQVIFVYLFFKVIFMYIFDLHFEAVINVWKYFIYFLLVTDVYITVGFVDKTISFLIFGFTTLLMWLI